MANKQWTVEDLMEALKTYPSQAKVYYEMGPNGPGTNRESAIRRGLGRGRGNGSTTGPIA
jgi:hypothetical protein